MIAKHSNEQSHKGEGVEVIKNEDCHDPVHGKGRLTEKRIYLSRFVYIGWDFKPFRVAWLACA